MLSKTIRIHNPGPAENMKWDEIEVPFPSEGYVTIKHSYVGLNYIDTYHREKVVYALGPPGSYSDVRNMPEKKIIKIPDAVKEKLLRQ